MSLVTYPSHPKSIRPQGPDSIRGVFIVVYLCVIIFEQQQLAFVTPFTPESHQPSGLGGGLKEKESPLCGSPRPLVGRIFETDLWVR